MNKLVAFAAALAATALPVAAQAASNDGYNREITVTNNSSHTVYRIVYGIPGQGMYQRDLLGNSVILADYHATIDVDDGQGNCNYVLRAQTQDGSTVWTKVINVCRESNWSLTD